MTKPVLVEKIAQRPSWHVNDSLRTPELGVVLVPGTRYH